MINPADARKAIGRKMKLVVRAMGVLFTLVYGMFSALWFMTVSGFSLEVVLLLVLCGASAWAIFLKEAARRTLIIAGLCGFLFCLIDAGLLAFTINTVSGLFGISSFLTVLFYQIPLVKREFIKGLEHPAWNILIIDDDKTLVKMLETHFTRHGLIVHSCSSGEKGLDMARRIVPDLIILDVILPKLKGREVCVRLKENVRTQDIPVVFLTVKDSPDDVMAEMQVGAVLHVTKPVDPQRLYSEIKQILKGK